MRASIEGAAAALDWAQLQAQLDEEGYAVVPRFFDEVRMLALCALRASQAVEASVPLASEGLGEGHLHRLRRPLPSLLQELCESFQRRLAPIADRWSELAGAPPRRHAIRPNATLTQLREGGWQALRQRASDADAFAFQLALLLGEPGRDFTGGEFIMVEQRPRMQSRPIVVPLRQGDLAIVAAAQRPQRGSHGYYRVKVRHAVSRVRSGERMALDVFFHDAGP